jgi:hypothetical protein
LNEAKRYDHYIDFEIIPQAALEAQDRFRYLSLLQAAGVEHPAGEAGLLPWRIIELYQSLVVQWRLWRTQPDATVRAFIEQRIINDAGILGHYVMDGSNPHHTSVHHDGWRTDYPNPRGFTTERGFHSRFESRFAEANVKLDDLLPHIRARRGGSMTCGQMCCCTCRVRTIDSSGSTSWTRSRLSGRVPATRRTRSSP